MPEGPKHLRIGQWYTPKQIRDLIDKETAEALELEGYVLQFDVMSQAYRVIPWHQAAGGGVDDASKTGRAPVTGTATFAAPAPIVKRTPQQRVDSLMAKWLVGMKKAGGLPTLLGEALPEGASTEEQE